MAGYTRQSVPDIQNGSEITAPPLNAEFNALSAAFHGTTGHSHDGGSGNSPKINLATSVSGYLPAVNGGIGGKNNLSATSNPIATDDSVAGYAPGSIWINTSANRLFVCISNTSSAAVWHEMVAIASNSITPSTTNTVDIGSSSLKFKDLHLAGNALVGGTLGVTGDATFANLSATGSTTITSVDLNSGAIDNTVIGNSTAVAGTFTNLTSTGTTTVATADINGGNIDGTIIGASTAAAGTFTNLNTTGTSTHATVDINGGAMDGTTIGANNAAAASFTTVSTSGQATLATVDINGGAIDGTIIGANSTAAITGTTVTATSGFIGDLVGDITGNITGNISGVITGSVVGNVNAGSGTSTFNNVTVNGTLDVTGTTIANVTDPSNAQDAATKNYVDTQVSGLVDSAPGTLNTLNELAAALGDNPNFSTSISNSIAAKLPLAGGTMSGAIAMGTAKITGLGDPTANQDAATKAYSDTTFLGKAGGTMSGAIAMGSQKITGLGAPSSANDAVTKTYVDTITGSLSSSQTNANAAAASATAAATSETNAGNSATAAASSATSAAASFDSFDDRYLGAKSSAPATDNDGDALLTGSLYFNSSTNIMNVYGSGGWQAAGSSVNGTSSRNTYTATAGQTTFAATYDTGFVDCFLNGTKLIAGTDFTATNGTSIVLASGAAANDTVDIVGYGTFSLATHYTKTESDARYSILGADVDFGSNKILYSNVYSATSDLPSASTYHGMFAHVHNTGKGYFAHAGSWVPLANDADLTTTTTTANAALPKSGGAVTGNVTFGDNNKAIFGAGSDLQIYHNGSDSFIDDAGTGRLHLRGNDQVTLGKYTGENMVVAVADGQVELYHDNSIKLATSATGVSVTGALALTGSVDFGNWTVTESGGSLYFATGGTNKMKLDASGNLDVVGSVNSNATIS